MSLTDSMEKYTDEKTILPPRNLDELVKDLHDVFNEDRVNVEYVKALLASYRSNKKDWAKYAHFDPHRYTRNLVDDGNGKFNLIALCWGEGHGSSIHSHGDSHCFVKVLDGTLMETMFSWPEESEEEEEMKQIDVTNYGKDGVTYINDSMGLHRMENPSHSDHTVSLHLYSPPYELVDTFDQRTGHKQTVTATFWSKFGNRTPFTTNPGTAIIAPENN